MQDHSQQRDTCLLTPTATAPASARTFISTALNAWGVEENFADVPLATSELVTNAVRHAESDVVLSIDLNADRLRIEVSDRSSLCPSVRDLETARYGGWGLNIVERVATRWGLEPRAGGKVVWCEFRG